MYTQTLQPKFYTTKFFCSQNDNDTIDLFLVQNSHSCASIAMIQFENSL